MIPSGPYTVVDFHYAGGVKQVMKQLAGKIHTDAPQTDTPQTDASQMVDPPETDAATSPGEGDVQIIQ